MCRHLKFQAAALRTHYLQSRIYILRNLKRYKFSVQTDYYIFGSLAYFLVACEIISVLHCLK